MQPKSTTTPHKAERRDHIEGLLDALEAATFHLGALIVDTCDQPSEDVDGKS